MSVRNYLFYCKVKAVAIGSIAGSIGYLFYAVAPSWGWLLVGHTVASPARCFVAPSFQAFIAEQSAEETRARVFAISESAFAVVGIVGPPIGGFLSQRYGFRWMFVAALLSPDYNSLVSKEVPISIRGTAFGLVSTTMGISIASGAVYRRVDVGQVRAQGSVRVAAIGQPGHGCNVLV
ncbi:MAG: MFS transporter [Clostridia bacterium]|nr:MFS transporter [Clostridia bacterium]